MGSQKLTFYDPSHCQLATLESNGVLTDIIPDFPESAVSAIYVGKIIRVLPSIHSAFIDIGESQNAFFSFSDIKKISSHFHEGAYYFFQVVQPEQGSKGKKVTPSIQIPLRYFVWKKDMTSVKCPKKLLGEPDALRLCEFYEGLLKHREIPGGGVIRTKAFLVNDELRARDLDYLSQFSALWCSRHLKERTVGLQFQPLDFELNLIRDKIDQEDQVFVKNERSQQKIADFCSLYWPNLKFKFLKTSVAMEEILKVTLKQLLQPFHELETGGTVVLEKTEAMWVMDVNGTKKPYEENLAAARMVANLCRLRNLSGIIVVDFINMTQLKQKMDMHSVLKQALEKDPVSVKFGDFSEHGLIEISRRRQYPELSEVMCSPCSTCEGRGYLSEENIFDKTHL